MSDIPQQYLEPNAARLIALIAESHLRLTGRVLLSDAGDPISGLWYAPVAIVAHNTDSDPRFFFGNAAALGAFETDIDTFVGMPSRLSAPAPERGERKALLERVARDGFCDDYAGLRITAKGRRFMVQNACVWNLVDAAGAVHGQAACFQP